MIENSASSPYEDRWILALRCPDRPGIVYAVAGMLAGSGSNIMESQQFSSESGQFFMRVEFTSPLAADDLRAQVSRLAAELELTWELRSAAHRTRTLIMVSREAHCLNDLLFRHRAGTLPVDIPAIVSNHPDLEDLASFYGIPFHHIPVTPETKQDAEKALRDLAAGNGVELIVLARYMQILSDSLCREYSGRIINIHHSFLPSFKGARPYAQAHQRGVKLVGATAHYVTADLDEGPIIDQDVVRVTHAHDVGRLVEMGRDVENRTLSRAVKLHAEHRVLLDGHRTVVFT